MGEAPGQPIWGRDDDGLQLPAFGGITQTIQGRMVNPGATVSLIPVYRACLERPALYLGPGRGVRAVAQWFDPAPVAGSRHGPQLQLHRRCL